MPQTTGTARVRTVLIGVTGRVGQALVRAALEYPQLLISGAIASSGSAALGRDAGELAGAGPLQVPVSADLAAALVNADVAIDFSSPAATRANVAACRTARTALLLGVTGYPAELAAELEAASHDIPLLIAPNTSVGVAVLAELVRLAARALPRQFDIDVLDVHHRAKRDAPSGTALTLGAAARAGRDAAAGSPATAPQTQVRPDETVGFASLRAGDNVGEHTVIFSGAGEQLSLGHRAADRAVYARGALAAALWLAPQPAGRYDMRDVLGIKSVS